MTANPKPHHEADIRAISNWIVREALGDFQLPALFEEMCRRMVAIGIPLARVNLGFETLHPMFIARVFLWEAGEGASVTALPHDFESSEEWRVNPVRPLVEEDREELRYRLETPGGWPELPVLRELSARGMTDYIAMRARFQSEDAPDNHFDGLVGTWTTTRPGGFRAADLDAIRRRHGQAVVRA